MIAVGKIGERATICRRFMVRVYELQPPESGSTTLYFISMLPSRLGHSSERGDGVTLRTY